MAKVFSPTERWSVCLAVIDFLRMFVLHPDGAALLLKTIETGNDVLMETFRKAVAPPVQPANLLTILKAVTNLFDSSCLHQWLRIHCAEIIDSLTNCKSSFSKNAHLAYATLLLNYSSFNWSKGWTESGSNSFCCPWNRRRWRSRFWLQIPGTRCNWFPYAKGPCEVPCSRPWC